MTLSARIGLLITAIGADIKALTAAISAKVQNSLTGSTTVAPSATAVNTALALKQDLNLAIQANTASYTLVLANNGKSITQNVATANTVTVPQNSSVAFPIGCTIPIVQLGAGQVTIVAGTGTTFIAPDGLKIAIQGGMAFIHKVAVNTWVVAGRLTT